MTTSPATSNCNSRIIKAVVVVTIIVVEVAEATNKTSQVEVVEVVEVIDREVWEALIKVRMTITAKAETKVVPGDRISKLKSQRRRRELETRSTNFTSCARLGIKSL